VSKSPNIAFRPENGPVLLYKESGFNEDEIKYFLQRCEKAKGKLPL
jgi:hypothetical protein